MQRELPACMYFKHGRYWYVKNNRWHKLSKSKTEAFRQYTNLTSPKGRMSDLIDDTIDGLQIRPSTRQQYLQIAPRIKSLFEGFAPSEVEPHHIHQIKIKFEKKRVMFNRFRSLLMKTFERAVAVGECRYNPVREVKPYGEKGRDRYITDDEFLKIRACASPWMALLMDLAYYTGQRVGDLLNLKESDIRSGEIYFRQTKTGNRVEIETNEAITATIEAARALHKTPGIYLFRGKMGKPQSYSAARQAFREARIKAKVANVQFRDIRAKSATDAESQGLNPTLLLGHSTPRTTDRYLRNKRTIRSGGLGKVLDKS